MVRSGRGEGSGTVVENSKIKGGYERSYFQFSCRLKFTDYEDVCFIIQLLFFFSGDWENRNTTCNWSSWFHTRQMSSKARMLTTILPHAFLSRVKANRLLTHKEKN